ncbi:MAG TPA: hypothetical protein PK040_02050 [Anaerolineaceae bacterium]|nr:hypothetical protein [Anaerolineaceae bacterium]
MEEKWIIIEGKKIVIAGNLFDHLESNYKARHLGVIVFEVIREKFQRVCLSNGQYGWLYEGDRNLSEYEEAYKI